MRLSGPNGVEHNIADCHGCWSPIVTESGAIAVLESDGIWVYAPRAKPRHAVKATGLRAILGRSIIRRHELVVVVETTTTPSYRAMGAIRFVNLQSGAVTELDGVPLLLEGAVLRAGQIQKGMVVRASTYQQDVPRRLLIGTLGSLESRPFSLRLEADDGVDRFDPVWSGSGDEIIYVARDCGN